MCFHKDTIWTLGCWCGMGEGEISTAGGGETVAGGTIPPVGHRRKRVVGLCGILRALPPDGVVTCSRSRGRDDVCVSKLNFGLWNLPLLLNFRGKSQKVFLQKKELDWTSLLFCTPIFIYLLFFVHRRKSTIFIFIFWGGGGRLKFIFWPERQSRFLLTQTILKFESETLEELFAEVDVGSKGYITETQMVGSLHGMK